MVKICDWENEMLKKYLLCFLVSMVPLIELRGGVPIAVGMGLNYWTALIVCVIGNMLPVPIIYFFARKVLLWGCDKKYIGKFFTYCMQTWPSIRRCTPEDCRKYPAPVHQKSPWNTC